MKIYTRYGDAGQSRQIDGQPIDKDAPRLQALGAVDELNVQLGSCLAQARADAAGEIVAALEPLQPELLAVGSQVASAGTDRAVGVSLPQDAVARLEGQIDDLWASLPELKNFLVPGGCELACRLHLARTACRRAERQLVSFARSAPLPDGILQYVNRLSDLLFALARRANRLLGTEETPWRPGQA